MMANPEVKLCLTMNLNRSFPYYVQRLSRKLKVKMACRLAAKKLLHEALCLRKLHAGKLLRQVRSINALNISTKSNFGDYLHSASSESFFFETACEHNCLHSKLAIDHTNRCIVTQYLVPCEDECMYNEPIAIDDGALVQTAGW